MRKKIPRNKLIPHSPSSNTDVNTLRADVILTGSKDSMVFVINDTSLSWYNLAIRGHEYKMVRVMFKWQV